MTNEHATTAQRQYRTSPISTNQKPTIYRNLYENTGPAKPKLHSQQSRGIHPMLFQCWITVIDAGPALKHYWASLTLAQHAVYLPGQRCRRWTNSKTTTAEVTCTLGYTMVLLKTLYIYIEREGDVTLW